jgi:hypothetical protein
LCHLDKTLEWTSTHLTKWYGAKPVELSAEDKAHSSAALLALKGDAGERALIAWHMGWKPAQEISGRKWLAPYLGQLLEDPYGTVRYIALRSLKSLPEFQRFDFEYISGPGERRRAHDEALKIWHGIKDLDRTGSEVLVDAEGVRSEWAKLLEQRNNRSMYLQE